MARVPVTFTLPCEEGAGSRHRLSWMRRWLAWLALPFAAAPLCAVASIGPASVTANAPLLAQACPIITVSPFALPAGLLGTPYTATVTQTGGTGAATFAVSSGTVASGLTFSSDGVLSGTPAAAGPSFFTVAATDANGCTGSSSYQLVVEPDPALFAQKLFAADEGPLDWFGWAVAVSADGTTAAIGALEKFPGATGAVYVFTFTGTDWVQQTKLTPAGALANDGFGEWVSVSVDGNTIVTGADKQPVGGLAHQGAGYVFSRTGTTWTQEPMLTASDGQANDYFGRWGGISPDGQTAIFGAPQSIGAFDPTAGPGEAYVFTRSVGIWSQQAKLMGSDVTNGEQFGWTVVVGTDLAVIAANLGDGVQPDSGAAYVFTRAGSIWTEQTKLTSNDGATADSFGWVLRLSEDEQTLLATAIGAVDAQSVKRGAGYVFIRSGDTWSQQAKLMTADGGSFFAGWAAWLSHDTVLLGSPFTTVGDFEVGAVFEFVRTGTAWTERSKLVASDPVRNGGFGYGVALWGDTAIVGAPVGVLDTGQGAGYVFHLTPVARAPDGDFDGDGKTDIAVYRPSTGVWYILTSSTNFTGNAAYQWGSSTDVVVPGDYDGDGKTDLAVFRPSTAMWYALLSSTNYTTYVQQRWGAGTDIPVPRDYDGDGKTDLAVFRPSTATWYVLLSSTNYTTYLQEQWGAGSDITVPGDYDGDGKIDLAVFRPSTATWYALLSSTNYTTYLQQQWGADTDITVPGDYDGDGKTDLAVFRPSTATWYALLSSTNYTTYLQQQWGAGTDITVPGDYDGDGKTDLAVFRPSTATWFALLSSTNYATYISQPWGGATDSPLGRRP